MHVLPGYPSVHGICRRLVTATGMAALLLCVAELTPPAQAQAPAPFTGPASQIFAPPPSITAPSAPSTPRTQGDPHQSIPAVAPGRTALALAARYSSDGPYIPRALHWRVFAVSDNTAKPELVAETSEAYPVFALPPGEYVVHAAYGLADGTHRISLGETPRRETLIVPGGGLRVQGRVGDVTIPPQRLRFDVYEGSFLQYAGSGMPTGGRSDRPPVVRNAAAGELVLLPAGTYYVHSTFGDGNSVIQADVRIEPGRLTDATVHHRAAQITLKLVSSRGGEAIANTQWSVLTPGGDSIKESIGAFPSVVLAEGEYIAVARHDGRTYQEIFRVETGFNREIEVLTR